MNQERLLSIDVFRGLTMAAMVLVENPGDWYDTYSQLRHARWGMPITLTDWIFPFFLFIMGLAIPFSILRRRQAGMSEKALVFGIARRSLILFGLGLLLYLYPGFNFASMRIPGVLQCLEVLYRVLFRSWLNPSAASLAFSLSAVLFWWIPLWALYKKKIYLRI